MLIRILAVFGLIFASGYAIEALEIGLSFLQGSVARNPRTILLKFSSMSLDLFFAATLAIAAVGLLFGQQWAKKMWLGTLSLVTLMHFLLGVFYHLGNGVSASFLNWTWMVVLVTALSWWYFTKQTTTNVPQPEN
jgi:hypothetical protein